MLSQIVPLRLPKNEKVPSYCKKCFKVTRKKLNTVRLEEIGFRQYNQGMAE
jgi:hypothetical protein